SQHIVKKRPQDFSFIQDMTTLLHLAKKQPIPVTLDKQQRPSFSPEIVTLLSEKIPGFQLDSPAFLNYLYTLFAKVRLLKLADVIDGRLFALEGASDWFDMRLENRALFMYRHPLNRLTSHHLPAQLCTERHVREAEKSIIRVLNSGWVYFE